MAQNIAEASRIEEEYACPSCSSQNYFSPTYKQKKCTSCGHRGTEGEFRASPEAECENCGDMAPKTHKHGSTDLYTCRGCFNQFEG